MAEVEDATSEPGREDAKEQSADSSRLSAAYDPDIIDAYTNNSEIIIGRSEVAITFFHDIDYMGQVSKPIGRLVMTHDAFLNFVSYCNTRAKFIQAAYNGPPPSLGSVGRSEEEIQKSIEDMYSRKRVVARFEFESDE